MIRLHLFGAPRLERDGKPLATDTRKALALLAYLAVTGRSHTRDSLAALLWGDSDEQHARGALRRTLSALRAAGGDDVAQAAGDTLAAGRDLWCDVAAFRAGLKAGPAELRAALDVAAAPFMAGFNLRDAPDFEEWQFLEAEALNRELAEALARAAGQLAERGDMAPALAYARRLLALDPLNEEAHGLIMRLNAYAGDQAAALRQYRECARVLDQELGVPPLPETTELYHAIRAGRLAKPSPGSVGAPHPARAPEPPRAPRPSLVGRGQEWSTLLRMRESEAPRGCCVALEGEAGIGKTRLAEEFLAHAQAQGASVAIGRCYERETGLAYGVVVDALRRLLENAPCADRLASIPPQARIEAARLLTELAPPGHTAPAASEPAAGPAASARFLEGLAQFLTGLCPQELPPVLFFDDLHWADEASLDFLSYLAHRLAGRSVCLILAWRNDGSPAAQRLRQLMRELARSGRSALLSLRRLTLADVRALLAEPGDAAQAERIYRESEGVPLFVTAYLEAAGDPQAPALPGSVRDLLAARLSALGEAERQLLQAAAVLGRSFDLDVLQAVSGRSMEETVAGVERLVERGVVREAPATRPGAAYDFDHDKLRELVYETTGAGRRRLLHERAARAWLALAPRRQIGARAAAFAADHLQRAGRDDEAAAQHVIAAHQAERVFANAEALAHYRAALALGYDDQAALREAIGDLEALRGNYAEALAAYEAAGVQRTGAESGRLQHKSANLRARLGDWDEAERRYAAADDALIAAHDASRAALYADWGLAAHQRGEVERAAELVNRALELAALSGDRRSLAQAQNMLGVIRRRRGDLPAAIQCLEAASRTAEKLGDAGAHAAALNNLALAAAESGDLERGVSLLKSALVETTRRGDRHREAALRNNLADLLHAQGREDESMTELKQAVALFAEIGAQAGAPRAEIWKLTEW